MPQHERTEKTIATTGAETIIGDHPVSGDDLRDQRTEILSRIVLFSCLPHDALVGLASVLSTAFLPAGAVIYRATDPGDTYYVIISGSVALSRNGDGSDIVVGVRGPGEGFGEISLLTGQPHTTTAVAREQTSLIPIPRATVLQHIFSHPAAAQKGAAIIAELVGHGYDLIVDVSVKGDAYRQVLSGEAHHDDQLLIGNSPTIMRLLRHLDVMTTNRGPVLVKGRPGTEMRAVAGLLHVMSGAEPEQLLEMDAGSARVGQGGHDLLFVEMAQAGTLYGQARNAYSFAPEERPGLLAMARDGTVVIEHVEHLGRDVQESLADMLEQGWYCAVGSEQRLRSSARIVATSAADLDALAADGSFDRRLLRLLSAQTVTVPPLRQRKRDLRIIVDELIRQNGRELNKQVRGITEDAYQSLMTYDWPGNTEELNLVIRRAVSISDADLLTRDTLFIGPPPVTGKYTLNLLDFKPLRWYVQHRLFPIAFLTLSVPFIVLIALLGLFGSQAPERNAVLVLTFGYWEPLVVMSTFFVSRFWCSVCPVGFMNRSIGRRFGLNLKTPQFLKDHGAYIGGSAIAVIFWAEAASDMLRSPAATAVLVLSIVGFGALSSLIFKRRAWCRYLCGLGAMVGTLSTCSVVELRANNSVCNNTCKEHECYTGTRLDEGCPMSRGPFALTSNQPCVMCCYCIKTCSLQSPVLNLRLPAYDLCAQNNPVPDRAVALLALFLIGSQIFRGAWFLGLSGWFAQDGFSRWAASLVLMTFCVLLAGLLVRTGSRSVFEMRGDAPDDRAWRMAYALVPLCFAFEVAFQLNRFLVLSGQLMPVLGRQLGLDAEIPGSVISLLAIRTLLVLVLAAGTAGSLGVLTHQHRSVSGPDPVLVVHRRPWPVLLLAVFYLAALMASAGVI